MEQKVTCLINFFVLLFRTGVSSKNFGNGSTKKDHFCSARPMIVRAKLHRAILSHHAKTGLRRPTDVIFRRIKKLLPSLLFG